MNRDMLPRWRHLVRDMRGSIVMAFALLAPILVGAVGLALDYSAAYLVQQRLQHAVDASALAAAASSDDPAMIEQKVKDFFEANYPPEELGITFDPVVTVEGDSVTVAANAT